MSRQRALIASLLALFVVGGCTLAGAASPPSGPAPRSAAALDAGSGTVDPAPSFALPTTTTTVAPATAGPANPSAPASAPAATTATKKAKGLSWVPPAKSGKGRRVVYANKAQQVWLVNGDGTVARTYKVSGRRWTPKPGNYTVYSRSRYTNSTVHNEITMEYMVRFAYAPSGNYIGFHSIPKRNGVSMQTEKELGKALSSGCVRQSKPDAIAMWNFAGVGTKVVVLP